MSEIWTTIIFNPIFNVLAGIYSFTGSLGFSIILFTILIKAVLLPVTIPQIKNAKKQRDLQPELKKLQKKFKYDKQKLAEQQMALFKKHGINPGSGCLTTIITLVLMIAVYRSVTVFTTAADISAINSHIYLDFLKLAPEQTISTGFGYLNLSEPDPYLIVTILAVGLQLIATRMMLPYSKVADKAVKKTKGEADDIMQAMQKQNMYIMPIMFFIFGLTLPSGVMLYIAVSTLFQIIQTYYLSGLGGLKPWINKLKFVKN